MSLCKYASLTPFVRANKLSAPPDSSALTARNNACARLACNPVRHGPTIRATIFLACMARSALRLDNEKRSTTGHACVVFTQTLLRKKLIRYNNMRGNLRVCPHSFKDFSKKFSQINFPFLLTTREEDTEGLRVFSAFSLAF